MKTCGTVRRPPVRVIISSCLVGSRSMRIFSISVTPRLFSSRSAATQYGQTAVQYMTTLAMGPPCSGLLGDRQESAFPRQDAARLVVHGLETGLFQQVAGARRALAATAGDEDGFGLEFLEFLETAGQLAERNVLGPGNVAGGKFLVFAHVEDQRVVVEKAGGFQRVGFLDAREQATEERPHQQSAGYAGHGHQHPVLLQELNVHVPSLRAAARGGARRRRQGV